MTVDLHSNPDRSFGVSVGLVLCAIAAALAWRGFVGRAEILGGIGVVLFVAGLLAPRLLKYPGDAWRRLSRLLGYVNMRVLLTILFSIALVPIGVIWRLTGKDPLARRRDRYTGWSPPPARYRNRQHYERMF